MAAVIFESVIKSNPVGRWYLELRDPQEGRTEVCLDLDEYAQKIEDMGAIYGGDVEVAWSAEENVTQIQINEVRHAMLVYEQKLADEEEHRLKQENSGFDPNA
jgi:hypothetical protein